MDRSSQKTPASYGLNIIAKVKPGREHAVRDYAKTIGPAVQDNPSVLWPVEGPRSYSLSG